MRRRTNMPGDREPKAPRPPLGLPPRKLWVEKRVSELDKAINRRVNTRTEIPEDWIQERNEHIEYLKTATI